MTFLISTKSYLKANMDLELDDLPNTEAILELIDNVSVAIENNEYTIGIFWDLSKAFDTVNHVIPLHKRQHYGVRGNALEWFRNYLTCRRQIVN